MYLCEILNRMGLFGDGVFQERFFHEPFFLRDFQIGENSSSIRMDDKVLWLGGIDAIRARKFRRIQYLLLHGDESEVGDALGSPVFAEYRAALYEAYKNKGLPVSLKIHRRHHFAFIGDEILDDMILRQYFENKDYVVLDRMDRVAQTVSLYIAYAKSQFIVTEESRPAWDDDIVPYNEDYLLTIHDMINVPQRRDWSPFISRASAAFDSRIVHIDYDQLLTDPVTTIRDVLEGQLGYSISREQLSAACEAVSLRPSIRPENRLFGDRLREALRRRSESLI